MHWSIWKKIVKFDWIFFVSTCIWKSKDLLPEVIQNLGSLLKIVLKKNSSQKLQNVLKLNCTYAKKCMITYSQLFIGDTGLGDHLVTNKIYTCFGITSYI